MVEIALCIAIIGFALVAIIGVLPTAMRVQQDNREDSLVEQDGVYMLEAIRHGAQGVVDLPNYVRRAASPPPPQPPPLGPVREVYSDGTGRFITNNVFDAKDYNTGWKLIGLLSRPRFTNDYRVEAEFRAISGAAIEKDPNSLINFEYLLVSEVVPFSAFDPGTTFGSSDTNAIGQIGRNLQNNLYELRLTLRWPLFPNGKVGNNRKVFRTLMSGTFTNIDDHGRIYSFLQPTTFLPTP